VSSVICHILLSERGGRLRGASVVGLHGRDDWHAPDLAAGDDVVSGTQQAAAEAADWIATATAELTGGRGRRLDRICIQTDGAVCAPLPVSGGTARLAHAEISRTYAGGGPAEGDDAESGFASPPRFPDLPGELTFQPLTLAPDDGGSGKGRLGLPGQGANGAVSAAEPRRLGVLALPDAPARLLLDRLDRQGIAFGPVVSIWHAIASVWDPGASSKGGAGAASTSAAAQNGAEVVSASTPTSAAVLIDPGERRLLWCWSHAGAVLTIGSARLGEEGRTGRLSSSTCGRLIAEWMSWSAQLGMAPDRIVCVGRFHAAEEATSAPALGSGKDDHAGNGKATRHGPLLDGPAIGAAFSTRWPSASVDLIESDDPVGLTLARYVERVDAARDPQSRGASRAATEIPPLSDRPGRAHRWMYRSVAAAIVVAAAVLVLAGLRLRGQAAEMRQLASALSELDPALIERIDPSIDPRRRSTALTQIRDQIESLRRRADPQPPFDPPKPILQELDTLAFVIGSEAYELERLRLNPITVELEIFVDELEQYEQLTESLRGIAGRATELTDRSVGERGGRFRATYTFQWIEQGEGEAP